MTGFVEVWYVRHSLLCYIISFSGMYSEMVIPLCHWLVSFLVTINRRSVLNIRTLERSVRSVRMDDHTENHLK